MDAGAFARKMGRGQAGVTVRFTNIGRERARIMADSGGLFVAIMGICGVSLAAFLLEAAVLGYIPFFVRGVPHAYSYFHISGVSFITLPFPVSWFRRWQCCISSGEVDGEESRKSGR